MAFGFCRLYVHVIVGCATIINFIVYTKEERKELITQFWEGFSFYCSCLPYLRRRRRKWLLHHTKVSNVRLKFEPGRNTVKVILEIYHKDESKRLAQYEKFEMYKVILEEGFENRLVWDFTCKLENGEEVCRIYTEKTGLDMHKISEWKEIYDFMAENMYLLEKNFLEIRELIE